MWQLLSRCKAAVKVWLLKPAVATSLIINLFVPFLCALFSICFIWGFSCKKSQFVLCIHTVSLRVSSQTLPQINWLHHWLSPVDFTVKSTCDSAQTDMTATANEPLSFLHLLLMDLFNLARVIGTAAMKAVGNLWVCVCARRSSPLRGDERASAVS